MEMKGDENGKNRPFLVTVDRQKKIGYNKKDMKTAKKAPGKKPLQ